jgi:hypothetical protein
MKYYALLDDNNVVTNVIVIADADAPTEEIGRAFIASLGVAGEWRETSYNHNFRGKYAGIGDTYDAVNDVFVAPTPTGETDDA